MTNPRFRSSIHGWIVLDKPLGLTSTQALGKVRRLIGGTKAGHGGTLDPLATGILPLAFGEATKLISHIMDGEKEYEFSIRWGENRSTDDAEGTVTTTSDVRPSADQIREILPRFEGTILQKPPAFSALKIQGERAYDLARAGAVVDLAPRDITVRSISYISSVDEQTASFRVSCGKGTYVRSLARDMAAALGTCGFVCALRRTKVGAFDASQMVSLPNLEVLASQKAVSGSLLPIQAALGLIPVILLKDLEAQTLRKGQKVLIKTHHGSIPQETKLFAEFENTPVALVEAKNGELKVLRGFHF